MLTVVLPGPYCVQELLPPGIYPRHPEKQEDQLNVGLMSDPKILWGKCKSSKLPGLSAEQ